MTTESGGSTCSAAVLRVEVAAEAAELAAEAQPTFRARQERAVGSAASLSGADSGWLGWLGCLARSGFGSVGHRGGSRPANARRTRAGDSRGAAGHLLAIPARRAPVGASGPPNAANLSRFRLFGRSGHSALPELPRRLTGGGSTAMAQPSRALALGRPCWLALPAAPAARWLAESGAGRGGPGGGTRSLARRKGHGVCVAWRCLDLSPRDASRRGDRVWTTVQWNASVQQSRMCSLEPS